MKKNIMIGLMAMLFVACGETKVNNGPLSNDAPKSPTTQVEGKTPPSVPKI